MLRLLGIVGQDGEMTVGETIHCSYGLNRYIQGRYKTCKGELYMFNVTEKASEMVGEFFKTREKVEPLRIFIAGIG